MQLAGHTAFSWTGGLTVMCTGYEYPVTVAVVRTPCQCAESYERPVIDLRKCTDAKSGLWRLSTTRFRESENSTVAAYRTARGTPLTPPVTPAVRVAPVGSCAPP